MPHRHLTGLFASLDLARRERDEARNDSQGMVDAVIYYRNLAISYGAKPEQMRGASDKKLCESGDFEFDDPHSFSLRDSVEEREAMWSAVSERDLARAELAKSEAACAEMRDALTAITDSRFDDLPCQEANRKEDAMRDHALSSDAGKGWFSPDDVEKVREHVHTIYSHYSEDEIARVDLTTGSQLAHWKSALDILDRKEKP
jgi:hypothetical protein